MPTWPSHDDAWDDDDPWQEADEDDAAPEDDLEDDEGHDTEPCRACGAPVYYDAEQCGRCGTYVTIEEPTPQRKSWLIGIGTLICFYIVYHWIFP